MCTVAKIKASWIQKLPLFMKAAARNRITI